MITAREIIKVVAEEFDLTFMDLTKQTRTRRISRPRQAAMYVVRKLRPDMSYPMIGRLFGGRDHTTIIHGIRVVEKRIESDPAYGDKIGRVFERVAQRPEAAA